MRQRSALRCAARDQALPWFEQLGQSSRPPQLALFEDLRFSLSGLGSLPPATRASRRTHGRLSFLRVTAFTLSVHFVRSPVVCLPKNTVGAAGAATPLVSVATLPSMPPPASSKASSGGVHSTGTPSSAYFDIRQPRRYVTARDARCAQISTQALICKLEVQEGVVYAVKIGNGDVRNAFPGFISAYRLRRVPSSVIATCRLIGHPEKNWIINPAI